MQCSCPIKLFLCSCDFQKYKKKVSVVSIVFNQKKKTVRANIEQFVPLK